MEPWYKITTPRPEVCAGRSFNPTWWLRYDAAVAALLIRVQAEVWLSEIMVRKLHPHPVLL